MTVCSVCPSSKPALAVATVAALWLDAAREGVAPALGSGTAAILGAGGIAFIIGLVIGRSKRRTAVADATLPREIEVPRLPVFLRFDRRRVVVVGGGTVAASKIPALVAAGGAVTVVAPSVSPAIDRSRVTVIEREFRSDDLDGAWFVTAAGHTYREPPGARCRGIQERLRERRG